MIRRQRDFPRTLEIGDSTWKIRFCKFIPYQKYEVVGLCCPFEQTIYILQGQTPKERFKTFVHEIFHALSMEHGFTIRHQIIYKLESTITDLLIDNGIIF